MDMGLNGKVAWVTGATGAIGREIALRFAEEGTRVAVSARTPDAVAALAFARAFCNNCSTFATLAFAFVSARCTEGAIPPSPADLRRPL